MAILSGTFAADGNSAVSAGPHGSKFHGSKTLQFTFFAEGAWGGGTAKVQCQPIGGSVYIDVPLATLSANGMVTFSVKEVGNFRINLAGATTPTINYTLV